MVLLNVLTLVYALVLVLVLAISLIRILRALASIARIFGKIDTGLKVVETQTSPLNGHIESVTVGLESIEKGLKSINAHLGGADKKLQPVAGG